MIAVADRITGGLLGLLIGDALGVPYEFRSATELPPFEQIDFEPPEGFVRSHAGVPAGTWSDDGAQALCLLESLLRVGHFDVDDFARSMVRWFEHGHMAVDGHVFDVGIQTAAALRSIRHGMPVLEAAWRDEHANGNGALMRVLPLALWHTGTDRDLARDARLSSLPTHGHLRSELCCALYCLWIRRLLQGEAAAWSAAVQTLLQLVASDRAATEELHGSILPRGAAIGRGTGYVVDTLHGALAAQDRMLFQETVRAAIALGGDTDTTAAVAGGAAGVRLGLAAIPARWLSSLRGRALVDPLLRRLISVRA